MTNDGRDGGRRPAGPNSRSQTETSAESAPSGAIRCPHPERVLRGDGSFRCDACCSSNASVAQCSYVDNDHRCVLPANHPRIGYRDGHELEYVAPRPSDPTVDELQEELRVVCEERDKARRARDYWQKETEAARASRVDNPKATYASGIEDAALDIADWIRSGIAASMFGSETWSLRRSLADEIAKGTWREQHMVDERVIQRVSKAAPQTDYPRGTNDKGPER